MTLTHPSYCGVQCESCPLYTATIKGDADLKLAAVKDWNLFKEGMNAGEIYCGGCKSSNVFGKCKECDIKQCNLSKQLESCCECDIFPCDRIKSFYDYQVTNKTGVKMESFVK